MAKRRSARGSAKKGGGGSGQAMAGLAVVAAVLGGGAYLYQHTRPAAEGLGRTVKQGEPAISAPGLTPRPAAGPATGPAKARTPLPEQPGPGSPAAGAPPVTASPATADGAAPAAKLRTAPFGTSEEVFEAGARVYTANCAGCHGQPGHNGKGPTAVQFWDRRDTRAAQALAQPAGSLYAAIAKGNVVQGMPSYGQRLTDTEIWDLALLLKSSREELPDPVLRLLHGGK